MYITLSKEIRCWASSNNVELHYTTPFHHQSNERVERFNMTIQEGIYKQEGKENFKIRLSRVLDVYNNIYHSKLGMSPNEALNPTNFQKVKEKQYEEILKFNERNKNRETEPQFSEGDSVIIKTETGVKKGEPKFKVKGLIYKVLENNTYLVRTGNKTIKRHSF